MVFIEILIAVAAVILIVAAIKVCKLRRYITMLLDEIKELENELEDEE